jgi:hypothetical protein
MLTASKQNEVVGLEAKEHPIQRDVKQPYVVPDVVKGQTGRVKIPQRGVADMNVK